MADSPAEGAVPRSAEADPAAAGRRAEPRRSGRGAGLALGHRAHRAVPQGLRALADRPPSDVNPRGPIHRMQAVALRCEHHEDIPCVDDPAPRLRLGAGVGRARRPPDRLSRARRRARGGSRRRARDAVGQRARRVRGDARRPLRRPAACRPRPSARGASRCGTPRAPRPGWSEPARFRTGPAAWTAAWIARDPVHDPAMPVPGTDKDLDPTRLPDAPALRPCPYFRRSFRLDRAIRRATLYATARGVVELELNGARVGDAVLAPGWTDYDERIEYAAHDVTGLRARRRERARRDRRRRLVRRASSGWTRAGPATTTAATRSSCASCTSSTRTAAAR